MRDISIHVRALSPSFSHRRRRPCWTARHVRRRRRSAGGACVSPPRPPLRLDASDDPCLPSLPVGHTTAANPHKKIERTHFDVRVQMMPDRPIYIFMPCPKIRKKVLRLPLPPTDFPPKKLLESEENFDLTDGNNLPSPHAPTTPGGSRKGESVVADEAPAAAAPAARRPRRGAAGRRRARPVRPAAGAAAGGAHAAGLEARRVRGTGRKAGK
jgi:hypothetical protein